MLRFVAGRQFADLALLPFAGRLRDHQEGALPTQPIDRQLSAGRDRALSAGPEAANQEPAPSARPQRALCGCPGSGDQGAAGALRLPQDS